MKINEVIRKRRKELNMTQERIADILGVSAPAVNKWENGNSYPDITLLAPLARVLEIDVNTLLSFHENLSSEDVGHILTEILRIKESEGFEAAFAKAQEAVRNYPNCMGLLANVALVMKMYLSSENTLDKSLYEKKLYEWLILVADSGEEDFSESALISLCNEEIAKKNFIKAQEYLDRISERKMLDKRIMQANICIEKGDLESAYGIYESKIYETVNSLFGTLSSLCQLKCREKDYDTALKIADLIEKTGEEFYVGRFQRDSAKLLVYMEMQKKDEVIKLLMEMVSDFNGLRHQKCYLNEHLKVQDGMSEELIKSALKKIMEDKELDFVREDVRFRQIMKKLEE